MDSDDDAMSDIPQKLGMAARPDNGEIEDKDGSPKVPSAFSADAMQRRSSLPHSIDSMPRSYARSACFHGASQAASIAYTLPHITSVNV